MSEMLEPVRFRKLPTSADPNAGLMVWFPHAGGSSAAVVRQTRGQTLKRQTWVAVLPHREERWSESATDVEALAREFDEALGPCSDRPLILAGHSFGGLLAFLVAQRRCQRGEPPQTLMPMAVPPPDRLEPGHWSREPDPELVDYLDRQYGAIPPALRNNPAALGQLLLVVRHDLRLLESYRHQPCEPLPVDLVACGGTDDHAVDETTIAGWRRFTQQKFTLKMLPGDHFFPYNLAMKRRGWRHYIVLGCWTLPARRHMTTSRG